MRPQGKTEKIAKKKEEKKIKKQINKIPLLNEEEAEIRLPDNIDIQKLNETMKNDKLLLLKKVNQELVVWYRDMNKIPPKWKISSFKCALSLDELSASDEIAITVATNTVYCYKKDELKTYFYHDEVPKETCPISRLPVPKTYIQHLREVDSLLVKIRNWLMRCMG